MQSVEIKFTTLVPFRCVREGVGLKPVRPHILNAVVLVYMSLSSASVNILQR